MAADGKRILVTGGSGFLGGHIVDAFLRDHPDHRITVLDIKPPITAEGVDKPGVHYVKADVTNNEEVAKAFASAKPDVVVHTAGLVPAGSSRYNGSTRSKVFKVNVEGTVNVLFAAEMAGVKALVYTSTCCVITDDLDHDYPNHNEETPIPQYRSKLVYGESKTVAESLIKKAHNPPKLSTCIIRPSVILGEGDYQLVPTVQACIAKWETNYIIGDQYNMHDFTYVGNVADAHVLAVQNLLTVPPDDGISEKEERSAAGKTFFISNGEPLPFRSFCLAIWAQFGHIPRWEFTIPRNLAWVAGYLSEWVTWYAKLDAATLSRGSVKDATRTGYAKIDRAQQVLGYKPRVSLEEGIKRSCDELKQRLDKNGRLYLETREH